KAEFIEQRRRQSGNERSRIYLRHPQNLTDKVCAREWRVVAFARHALTSSGGREFMAGGDVVIDPQIDLIPIDIYAIAAGAVEAFDTPCEPVTGGIQSIASLKEVRHRRFGKNASDESGRIEAGTQRIFAIQTYRVEGAGRRRRSQRIAGLIDDRGRRVRAGGYGGSGIAVHDSGKVTIEALACRLRQHLRRDHVLQNRALTVIEEEEERFVL